MRIFDVEQNTPEWLALRAGNPTGSGASRIVTSEGKESKSLGGYANQLAGEKFAGKPLDSFEGTKWTERGHQLEEEAISAYEFERGVFVQKVGFVMTDDLTFGVSPDGLVGDDGMVEVKCQKAENHIATILYFNKHGHAPAEYVVQTQAEMLVTGRKWCDILYYHPDLPMLAIRQFPDKAVRLGLESGVKKLISERDQVLSVLKSMGGK